MQLSYLSDNPLGSIGSLEEGEPEAWVETQILGKRNRGIY
jgi:hypothetical protein